MLKSPFYSSTSSVARRDRLVVRTLRCGRSNPGSNPGPGIILFFSFSLFFLPLTLLLSSLESLKIWSVDDFGKQLQLVLKSYTVFSALGPEMRNKLNQRRTKFVSIFTFQKLIPFRGRKFANSLYFKISRTSYIAWMKDTSKGIR